MLSQEEVKHIASLARIGLHDGEIEKYRNDLSAVLDFFAELQELDTSEPIETGVPEKMNDYREDRIEDSADSVRDRIRENAPDTKDGYIKVRSVF